MQGGYKAEWSRALIHSRFCLVFPSSVFLPWFAWRQTKYFTANTMERYRRDIYHGKACMEGCMFIFWQSKFFARIRCNRNTLLKLLKRSCHFLLSAMFSLRRSPCMCVSNRKLSNWNAHAWPSTQRKVSKWQPGLKHTMKL